MIYRFKTDSQFGPVRPMERAMTPATCRLFTSTKAGDKAVNFKLSSAADKFLKQINSKPAYQYLTGLRGGWSNQTPYPRVEQLTFQNNEFIGEQVDSIWTMVYTLKYTDTLTVNSVYKRDGIDVPMKYFIHRWWNIKRSGTLMPGKTYANQARILILSENGYLFVPNYKVAKV